MVKIGVIINPYSKKILKMKHPVEFYKKTGGDTVDIRLTRTPGDVIKAAEDFKRNGITYVAISGGDGSIHLVISKFISVYQNNNLPYFLILKDGSMNNIAKSYKLKDRGRGLLKKLIKKIKNNDNVKIFYRDTIKVNNMYCFLFGLGFTANFINMFNEGGNKSPLKAIRIIFKTIYAALSNNNNGLFSRQNLIVTLDGKELSIKEYFAIYAATIHNLALGFYPTPRAYEKEKSFHIIATGLRPIKILLNINKIRRGRPINHPYHYDNIASEMKIIHPGEFLYQMDGDIYKTKDELTVQTGPTIGFIYV